MKPVFPIISATMTHPNKSATITLGLTGVTKDSLRTSFFIPYSFYGVTLAKADYFLHVTSVRDVIITCLILIQSNTRQFFTISFTYFRTTYINIYINNGYLFTLHQYVIDEIKSLKNCTFFSCFFYVLKLQVFLSFFCFIFQSFPTLMVLDHTKCSTPYAHSVPHTRCSTPSAHSVPYTKCPTPSAHSVPHTKCSIPYCQILFQQNE